MHHFWIVIANKKEYCAHVAKMKKDNQHRRFMKCLHQPSSKEHGSSNEIKTDTRRSLNL